MEFPLKYSTSNFFVEVEIHDGVGEIKHVWLNACGLAVDSVDVTSLVDDNLREKIHERILAICCDELNREARADRHNDDPDNG